MTAFYWQFKTETHILNLLFLVFPCGIISDAYRKESVSSMATVNSPTTVQSKKQQ